MLPWFDYIWRNVGYVYFTQAIMYMFLIKLVNEAYSWVHMGKIAAFEMLGEFLKNRQLLGRLF